MQNYAQVHGIIFAMLWRKTRSNAIPTKSGLRPYPIGRKIVQSLYNDIRKITDTQNLSHPPCVQDYFGDIFYMTKPFMIMHEWTTNDVNRT